MTALRLGAALLCLALCAPAAAAAAEADACGIDCRSHSAAIFRACLLDIEPAGRAVFPEDGAVYEHARRWGAGGAQGAAGSLQLAAGRPAGVCCTFCPAAVHACPSASRPPIRLPVCCRTWNSRVLARPAAVYFAHDTAGAAAAVACAYRWAVRVSPAAGRQSLQGAAVVDGYLTVDVSNMTQASKKGWGWGPKRRACCAPLPLLACNWGHPSFCPPARRLR